MNQCERHELQIEARLTRRTFLHLTAGLAAGVTLSELRPLPTARAARAEATIAELQAAMASGQLTAHALVASYLARIEALNHRGPQLNAIIEVNPDALAIAAALDEERKARGARGLLHGIPILLKDNIDTADRMMTTAGSLALVGGPPARDARVAKKLRDAGAILLGKANLSEWANFRGHHSRNGWSARGGQTRNPYVLNKDPYGSSSGSAVAAATNMCAAALGTETDGSIMLPAWASGLVGIKPTAGLTSRAGVVPISRSQDSIGPLARTVADAAAVLGAIVGVDPRDPGSRASAGGSYSSYTPFLDPNGLKGARIGLPSGRGDQTSRAAIQALQDAGATLITVAIPPVPSDADAEWTVLLYEFKADLNAYLATRTGVPIHTLEEAIAFNQAHAAEELKLFGQEIFVEAQKKGPLTDGAYLQALKKSQTLLRKNIDQVMEHQRLDALVAPPLTQHLAARAGYPIISVPAGFNREMPVNLEFMGRAYSEPTLIKLAYAFEHATKARRPPHFLKSRPRA